MLATSPHNSERLLQVLKEHWIKYVAPTLVFLLLLAISTLLFFLAGLSAHHYMWVSHFTFLGALLLFLLSQHWFFIFLLSESADCIIVTNRRVIHLKTRLFFQDDLKEIAFEKLKFVHAKKEGILQNILRYGTLSFEGKASVPYVPHPNRVAQQIEQAMGLR